MNPKLKFAQAVLLMLMVSGVSQIGSARSLDLSNEPIRPISTPVNLDPDKRLLGQVLFHDTRLSGDESISCATCHPLDRAGADGLQFSKGINDHQLSINTPTVLNASLNFVQFWDGRAATLKDQAQIPIVQPNEMAGAWDKILTRISGDQGYQTLFKNAFGEGQINQRNVIEAIVEFEKGLVTPGSRFDQFLMGDLSAISDEEREGYSLFKSYGCVSCHQGQNVGGNMYEKMGLIRDYFADRGDITEADFGRYNATGKESDRFYFKVPSLRNIEKTAPYFHDGSAQTLEEAINVMAKYQLGRRLRENDVQLIIAFLKSLSAEVLD